MALTPPPCPAPVKKTLRYGFQGAGRQKRAAGGRRLGKLNREASNRVDRSHWMSRNGHRRGWTRCLKRTLTVCRHCRAALPNRCRPKIDKKAQEIETIRS